MLYNASPSQTIVERLVRLLPGTEQPLIVPQAKALLEGNSNKDFNAKNMLDRRELEQKGKTRITRRPVDPYAYAEQGERKRLRCRRQKAPRRRAP